MPDLDRANRLISGILEHNGFLDWTGNISLAMSLLRDEYCVYSLNKNASGYFVLIGNTPWTGRCRDTLALAICDAVLRQHGMEMGD